MLGQLLAELLGQLDCLVLHLLLRLDKQPGVKHGMIELLSSHRVSSLEDRPGEVLINSPGIVREVRFHHSVRDEAAVHQCLH